LNPGINCNALVPGNTVCVAAGSGSGGGGGGGGTTGGCSRSHTIQSGDSCWKIWTDNGLSEQELYSLNPGINCNALVPGNTVCVAAGSGGGGGGGGGTTGGCSRSHTIQSGDSCWKIWTDNGLSEQELYSLNPGINCNALVPGNTVCVAAGSGGSGGGGGGGTTGGCSRSHTIQSGDSCWKIWTDNGLSEQELYSLNPGINCNALVPGNTVCVAAGSGGSGGGGGTTGGCSRSHTIQSWRGDSVLEDLGQMTACLQQEPHSLKSHRAYSLQRTGTWQHSVCGCWQVAVVAAVVALHLEAALGRTQSNLVIHAGRSGQIMACPKQELYPLNRRHKLAIPLAPG